MRSIYRYEKSYRNGGFTSLKPTAKDKRPSPKLPVNFSVLLDEAIQLKREVPSRSINQIISIMGMEGMVTPGILSRPTLQRVLYERGYGKKQMKKYVEAKATSSGRFVKPHRMMLIQADIKYGPKLPIGKDGAKVQTYLSAAIDDHSRFIISSGFYDNQEATIVEDTFHKAVLKYGKFDVGYLDNGKQYVSKQLLTTCAKLGIRLMHCKPYVAKSKGYVKTFIM